MFSKKMSRSAVLVLGFVFALSICIGLSANIALAENPPGFPDLPDECGNNDEFTTDFRLEDCKFKTKGINPYFILKPGFRLVLETPEDAEDREKSVETVLCDTKVINLDGRKIKTRVLEERAFVWDEEAGEWVIIEISLNWFAICKKTNAVYYFGEFSRDCDFEETGGFEPNDESQCADGSTPVPAGSWEAGKPPMDDPDGAVARPGVIMPGTPLLGAKYFQEIAPPGAVDRGEIAGLGLDVEVPAGDWSGCIEIFDTNPTPDGECGEDDAKLYCPGVGLVQDQELELVEYGFVSCDEEDDDDDDHDDDDDPDKRKRWGRR